MYTTLSDEELIKLSIDFVKTGETMPDAIIQRLDSLGLKELILYPISGDLDE